MPDVTTVRPKRIFIICPVRGATDEEKKIIGDYIMKLESEGHNVHYPPRNTNQNDPIGLNICTENREAIVNADEVHIFWNKNSQGTLFDIGMTFMALRLMEAKNIVIINPDTVLSMTTEGKKSFENVLVSLTGLKRM